MASYFDEPGEYSSGALFVTINFETMLREDHPAMLIQKFISTINIKPFKKRYKVGKGKKGRAPKGIRMMIGLILYGIYSRIYSAHQLDYASDNYSDFWIFTHKKRISHDKISDFLNLHGDQLINVFLETIILAETNDLLSFEAMFQDGFLIKANASKRKNRNMKSLNNREQQILEALENIIKKFKEKEENEDIRNEQKALTKKIEKISELTSELNDKIENREQQKRKYKMDKENILINETDKDSNLMKMKDKSYANAYLKITATDPKADILVGSLLTGYYDESHNSVNLFRESNENCKGLGKYDKICFDSGFNTMGTSVAFEAMGVTAIGPTKEYENESRNPEKQTSKIKMTYNQEKNVVICSEGATLSKKGEHFESDKQALLWIFNNPDACRNCSRLNECTKSKSGYRNVKIDSRINCQQKVLENYKSEEGQKIYNKRSHVAETFQGDLKQNGKFHQFYRRGLEKVKIDSLLHDIAWNLRRIINIKGADIAWNKT